MSISYHILDSEWPSQCHLSSLLYRLEFFMGKCLFIFRWSYGFLKSDFLHIFFVSSLLAWQLFLKGERIISDFCPFFHLGCGSFLLGRGMVSAMVTGFVTARGSASGSKSDQNLNIFDQLMNMALHLIWTWYTGHQKMMELCLLLQLMGHFPELLQVIVFLYHLKCLLLQNVQNAHQYTLWDQPAQSCFLEALKPLLLKHICNNQCWIILASVVVWSP